jgi:competence protein ComEC
MHGSRASVSGSRSNSNLNPLSLESAPVLLAGLMLCAGIVAAQHIALFPPAALGMILACTGLTLLARKTALPIAWLPLASCWFVLGLLLAEVQPGPDPQRQLVWIAESGGAHAIEGEIVRTGPVRTLRTNLPFSTEQREENSESIDIRIHAVDGASVSGGLRTTIYAPATEAFPVLSCGGMIRASLVMHSPERYLDPGVWNSNAWLLSQGIGVLGSLKLSAFTVLPGHSHATLACRLHSLQQAGAQRLLDFAGAGAGGNPSWTHHLPAWLQLSPEDAEMLGAMILGDRTFLNRQTRAGFERTGSFHLLVVSGMHLAIFAGFIFFLARLSRVPALGATLATIAGALPYALLTGYGEPVQRSFWMVTFFLLGRLVFRERNSLNAIGFAALCLLAMNPRSLLESSFQMTLLSVAVIAGVVLPVSEHTFGPYLKGSRSLEKIELDPSYPPKVAQFRVTVRLFGDHLEPLVGAQLAHRWFPGTIRMLLWICELLLTSVCIELAMALPMAAYFHRVTLLALPVNVLIVPLVAIALPAALLMFLLLMFSPAAAAVPAIVTAALLHAIDGIVRLFSNFHAGDLRIPGPSTLAACMALGLLAFAAWAARNSRVPVLLSLGALICSAACVLYPRPLLYRAGELEVTAIDVGQGDSLLLITPQGKTLLIDAGGPTGGPSAASESNFDIGEDVVSPVLWSRNVRRLDAIELTHAHSDHMGGMPAVLKNFRPREMWVGKNPPIPAYQELMAQAAGMHIPVHHWIAGNAFDFGGVHVDVLSPTPDYEPGKTATNDDSLVIRVSYGKTAALLEGDAQSKSEARMLHENLKADLLKVGHHGSKSSTTPAFLAEVDPKYAIISVGHRNPYGHPRIEILDRLQDDHVHTFRTDALGASSFYLDGTSVTAAPIAAGPAPY